MSPSNLVWWLHGWSEINGGGAPNAQQWQIIVDHLELVRAEKARGPIVYPYPGQSSTGRFVSSC